MEDSRFISQTWRKTHILQAMLEIEGQNVNDHRKCVEFDYIVWVL